MKMFDKMVDGTMDHYLKEEIWFCISENWAILIPDPEDGVSTTSAKSAKMIAPNVAGLVIDLAVEKTKVFFKDQYETHYALVTMSDHDEVIRLESGKFKRYLAKLYYDTYENRVANPDAIGSAIQILQAKAEYSDTIPLSLRVAKSEDGSIYYDLTDAKYRSVKIDPTANKWDIIDDTPVLFTRYNQSPQVLPSREYEDGVFDKFIGLTNIKEQQDRLLLKVYIISLFIPEIAHVMLLPHGEKGSAKSTLQVLIKMLVDPSKPTLLTVNNDKNEFIQQCYQNYVVYYDNLKHIPPWLSDEACKAVTGVGSSKRKLYTDSDAVVYEYKRCLGFNGINIMLHEPDALDRSLMIELERIPKESRRLESEIYAEFEGLKSGLLGYIFDVIVNAMQIKSQLTLDDKPRMADFALWGESIARAMKYEPFEFLNAYYDNIGKQNIEVIEFNPFGQAIVGLVDKVGWYYGSVTECLEALLVVAEENKINIDSKAWPKTPAWVSRYLNKIKSNLLEGPKVEVVIKRLTADEENYKKGTSTIQIRKIL